MIKSKNIFRKIFFLRAFVIYLEEEKGVRHTPVWFIIYLVSIFTRKLNRNFFFSPQWNRKCRKLFDNEESWSMSKLRTIFHRNTRVIFQRWNILNKLSQWERWLFEFYLFLWYKSRREKRVWYVLSTNHVFSPVLFQILWAFFEKC